MIERNGFSGVGVFFAFVGGAAAGAAIALLVAPTSGDKARERIKRIASDSKVKVARVPQALKSAYSQASEVAKDAFNEAYSNSEHSSIT